LLKILYCDIHFLKNIGHRCSGVKL
jgi:hypothetical protein